MQKIKKNGFLFSGQNHLIISNLCVKGVENAQEYRFLLYRGSIGSDEKTYKSEPKRRDAFFRHIQIYL